MTDKRRTDRAEKIKKLKDGTLKGRLKADFQFKMSKILERELIRLEELSDLLDATPDNYLENINFKERAVAAMGLTQKLIDKTEHAPILEMDGIKYATKQYLLTSLSLSTDIA
jgi:predicted methyltransferase